MQFTYILSNKCFQNRHHMVSNAVFTSTRIDTCAHMHDSILLNYGLGAISPILNTYTHVSK